jgi:hypothetical protein
MGFKLPVAVSPQNSSNIDDQHTRSLSTRTDNKINNNNNSDSNTTPSMVVQHQSVITSGLLQSPRLSSIESTCSEKYPNIPTPNVLLPVTSSPLIYSTLQPVHSNHSLETLKYLQYSNNNHSVNNKQYSNQWPFDLSRKHAPSVITYDSEKCKVIGSDSEVNNNRSSSNFIENLGINHHHHNHTDSYNNNYNTNNNRDNEDSNDNLINNANQNNNNNNSISQVHQNPNNNINNLSSNSTAADMRSSLLLDDGGSGALNNNHPIEIDLGNHLVDEHDIDSHHHHYMTLESAAAAHLHEFKENHQFNHIHNNNNISIHNNNNSVSSVSVTGGDESPHDEDYESGLPNYVQLTSLQSRLQQHSPTTTSHPMYASSSPIQLHNDHGSIIHSTSAYENLHHSHHQHQTLAR